ncbi:MAG: hypothetical protein ACI35Q_09395 [Marinilabiliaceae bacterium]
MKRIGTTGRAKAATALRTVAMAVAVMALLTALVVPHHHHRTGICVATTECHVGQHGHDGADTRGGAPCIDKEAFINAKKQTTSGRTSTICPSLATATEAGHATAEQPITKLLRVASDDPTPTPPPTAGHGMRAPPAA